MHNLAYQDLITYKLEKLITAKAILKTNVNNKSNSFDGNNSNKNTNNSRSGRNNYKQINE